MKITGAVLEEIGRPGPYASSRPLVLHELELDAPRKGELLVEIEAAGICHSDLSVVNGSRDRPVPMLLGHEAAGRVIEVGDGVADVKTGDRVVMTFLPRCADCAACATGGRLPCERGSASNAAGELLSGGSRLTRSGERVAHHLGVSAFASHAVVDRRSVVVVDDDVPPDVAALLGCALLTGGGAVINAGLLQQGEAVIVVGLGGVGMAALMTAVSLGLGPVYGVDAMPGKLDTARALGATEAFALDADELKELRAPLVVEAVGKAKAFELALRLTAPGGRTVTVGLPAPTELAQLSPLLLVSEARQIIGSYLGSAVPERDIPLFADLWRSGRLPVERLVSDRLPLDRINEGMDELANGSALRQIVLL